MYRNTLPNTDIREKIKAAQLRQHEVFTYLRISEPTWTRLMRQPLSQEKRTEVINAIDVLIEGKVRT